jgi:RNA polymerase sigma-70 factor (ECF subfamily)
MLTIAPPAPGLPDALTVESVYRDYSARVYSVARSMCPSDADADDAAGDVWVHVCRKLDTFRGDSALPTWLHRVTVNAVLARRRRAASRLETCPLEAIGEQAAPTAPVATPIDPESARAAIDTLPGDYRAVISLSAGGATNPAIAGQLGLSVPAVKSRLHRARQMLREALSIA